MKALFIRQDHVSPLGFVGERFAERGFDVEEMLVVPEERFGSPNVERAFPDPLTFDVIVPMGAPWSVYDDATVGSWVGDEMDFLAQAHAGGVPVLGICFGGQALAAALGGSVEAGPAAELGWVEIETDAPELVGPGPWFQFHHDRWVLPPGARELARSPQASQAFVLGRSLAVQFHPELTADILRGWNANGGDDYLRDHGIDPASLVARTESEEPAAAARTARLVDAFLDKVATAGVVPAEAAR